MAHDADCKQETPMLVPSLVPSQDVRPAKHKYFPVVSCGARRWSKTTDAVRGGGGGEGETSQGTSMAALLLTRSVVVMPTAA